MDKNYLKNKSTEDINRISVKCMRIITYFLLVFYALLVFSGKYNPLRLLIVVGICIAFSLLPVIIVPLFRMYEFKLTRHLIIFVTVIISIILITEVGTAAYAIVMFPILLASMYTDRTFILFTSLLESAGILASTYFQTKLPDKLLKVVFFSYEDILTGMTLPLILIVICLSFVAFFIVSRNALMIDKYIDTAITMQENEKYLVYAFSEISETKSLETGEHIKRVAEYMKILGRASGFDEEYTEKLATAAMMHDLGKLMIPEEVLDKPGRLTDEEFQIMKSHVLYGEALLKNCPGELMKLAATMAKEHHEKWDGSGYLGMKGKEIAYISRLIALADVFDALTAERSYKKGWTVDEAYDEIIKGSGKHFDPAVVRLFIKNKDKFRAVHDAIPDKKTRNQ